MHLTKIEEEMLAGKIGPAVELAMKTIVQMGEGLDAERLITTEGSHLGNVDLLRRCTGYIGIVEKFVELGAEVQIPTSVNPYPADPRNAESPTLPDVFKGPSPLEDYYRKLRVIPNWTCTPYLYGNTPRFGQHLSWEESSAVIYVNSVIGARANREPILMDLVSAITGKTLYSGLHLDENRTGEILCHVKVKELKWDDFAVIGYYLGKVCGTAIPVIDGIQQKASISSLKNMGAAAASTGAISMYHIPGLTPEAPTLEKALGERKPTEIVEIDDRVLEKTKEEMSSAGQGGEIDIVGVGCPHYTFDEVASVARLLKGKKVKEGVQLWICAHQGAIELAKQQGIAEIIKEAGGRLFSGCLYCLHTVSPYADMRLMSDSGKICYYRRALYGTQRECVAAATGGRA
ncbi:MAG: aconitase X catalytic domain-containing protein [Desulfobacteraceae bacterium]|jgi:predicted aconitase